jgi:hypothetical protein
MADLRTLGALMSIEMPEIIVILRDAAPRISRKG